jgi:lipoprotein-anchoring transpeptidase ErfK/SrfK
MIKVGCVCSITALIAATALSCGSVRAQQRVAFIPPQAQDQVAGPSPAELAKDDSTVGDEDAQLPPRFRPRVVAFESREAPGTIIIDTPHTYLYYVLGNGKAIRYGIGVGREGFTWSGVKTVVRKTEWPDWYPPPEMIQRQPYLPRMMAGGPGNPLGARAMYIGGTEYRIHGTNDPTSIGKDVSSGCIHLTNEDAINLYNRVTIGAKVIVLPQAGAPTQEAETQEPPPQWQTEARDAIAENQMAAPQTPADTSQVRMTWNLNRPAGPY